uniref:Uncharacterized protein n=1 Tax=Eutreptiella gymnastica TaxID=73025 RepID=A0A7S1NAS8_9EUGL|mmetsp:Transcript_146482/g.255874  ORF Transcript_146482/g.255874 Transcript_146482/m.255874 type:complete len:130 (+) Transcript_146482:1515-1904(+)
MAEEGPLLPLRLSIWEETITVVSLEALRLGASARVSINQRSMVWLAHTHARRVYIKKEPSPSNTADQYNQRVRHHTLMSKQREVTLNGGTEPLEIDHKNGFSAIFPQNSGRPKVKRIMMLTKMCERFYI